MLWNQLPTITWDTWLKKFPFLSPGKRITLGRRLAYFGAAGPLGISESYRIRYMSGDDCSNLLQWGVWWWLWAWNSGEVDQVGIPYRPQWL